MPDAREPGDRSVPPPPPPPAPAIDVTGILRILREYVEGLFPKTCPTCEVRYDSLHDYVARTVPAGAAVAYDVETGDWQPSQPLGTFALAHCACGTTLTITTDQMPLATRHLLLAWTKAEAERRGVDPQVLVAELRADVRRAANPPT